MKLAISNIAWPPGDTDRIFELMAANGFTGLELAPGMAFPDEADPFQPSRQAESAWRAKLDSFGLVPVSMQSILFGVGDAQMFGSDEQLVTFERSMARAIDLAERLQIPSLVFGCPSQRSYPADMSPAEAARHAADVFARIGDRAVAAGTRVSLETNPPIYGTNFLNTLAETMAFCALVDHPGIAVNLDLGAVHYNDEGAYLAGLGDADFGRISHIHISEPNLLPAPADADLLLETWRGILKHDYRHWISIEMRNTGDRAIEVVRSSLETVAAVARQLAGQVEG